MNITLDDLLYSVKKIDERLLMVMALLDDNKIEEALKILKDLTGC